uniref:ATP synthase F0 subunit 8 n=1 Tax=Idris sp. MM-2013 TaxID=1429433 RepID=A0A067YFR2_9HYME|nr:ATP synthase F0 subunit 8 [Idris sp. MM-2013]
MPQMSPLLWIFLMNFTLLNLMTIMTLIYFFWYPFLLNSSNKLNFKMTNYKYKW